MAIKTLADLETAITNVITTNDNGDITAADLRSLLTDIAASTLNLKDGFVAPAGTVASGATTDIGAIASLRVTITGTTTIAGLGSGANLLRIVEFADALTLTHNATSLILPGGDDITTATGDVAIFASDGSGNWRCLSYLKASLGIAGGAFESDFLHVQDQKPAGTVSGSFTAGAWRTRDLNTVLTNEITGASLSSNQITLAAGTYYIEASAPAYSVNRHKVKLYNVTDASDEVIGTSNYLSTGNGGWVFISGRFTISATKTFEIQHRCTAGISTNGFGVDSNFSIVEVYADAKIWRVD